MGLRFTKMHGAGNDFVVIDRRSATAPLDAALIARLCDRHRGVGCDQLLTIEPPRTAGSAFGYGIWNQDGSPAGQCGNGARCVVAWARRARIFEGASVRVDSPSGPVQAALQGEGIEIDMGRPDFSPHAVGFDGDRPEATLRAEGHDWWFGLVSMGNPHAVTRVDGVEDAPVSAVGRALQADRRFSDSCNVGFAELIGRDHIALRVFERGVGETLACGSGACAAVAVLHRQGLLDDQVRVTLPGGDLHIRWSGDGSPVRMRGPAQFVFEGEIEA
ncbi:diaminopimelate epimerase [Pseudomarimonas salicorniae]|uniref:Diaminopimelate epimerase n=1 Tax=Pseudomarimonas salicorniae TaxID=2933270 RepID=A0ABT0GFN0_9GAMM|nr:diaminopimelate epimerase [Lysobacter sp. CAU 1642]MCK7592830.1 diaminopimelate epimerase [Lysobacter sp. CAU 1642]